MDRASYRPCLLLYSIRSVHLRVRTRTWYDKRESSAEKCMQTFSLQGKYWCDSQCERVHGFRAVEGAGGCGCRLCRSKILPPYRGKTKLRNDNSQLQPRLKRSSICRYDTDRLVITRGNNRVRRKSTRREAYAMIPIPTAPEAVIAFGGKVQHPGKRNKSRTWYLVHTCTYRNHL